ncbi:MAG: phosphoglycolate phosphatase [Candidatus Marinimicrobia bacterium]|nr:phosphoglycolate phosphatase [Candidatus Neomarinimicrobiota bacterium]
MDKTKLLIFDLDGTLVNSFNDIAESVNETLRNFGYNELDKKVAIQYIGDGIKKLVSRAFGKSLYNDSEHEWKEEELTKFYNHYVDNYEKNLLNTTVLYPCVKETIEKLKLMDTLMVVLSNKNERLSKKILEALKVKDYFDLIFGGDSFTTKKPDPNPILNILKYFSVSVDKAMIVGDSENDIIAGKNAGIKTCAVTYGLKPKEELEKHNPDYIIDEFKEILNII